MPRESKPWRRASAGGDWYATVAGRKVKLADAAATKTVAARALKVRLDQAEAARARGGHTSPETGALVLRYLADVRRRIAGGELAAGAERDLVRRLTGFPQMCGAIPADAIRPKDVAAWLATRTRWGPTTRHDGAGAVQAVFGWAVTMGHLGSNPLAGMKKATRRRRELVMDAEALPRFLAAIQSEPFRELVTFLHETGARPGEASRLEARHIDFGRGLIAMEGKTSWRTKRARMIHLNAAMVALCRRLAEAHPTGPIFRNGKGMPWTKDAMNCMVRRVRQRSGLGREAIMYALRHTFVTDALERGVSVAATAELAGHQSPAMIALTYSRLSDRHAHLKEALQKVRPGGE